MRLASQAISITFLLTASGTATADDLGMGGLGALMHLVQYYAVFFALQLVVCCVVAARRAYSGRRLAGGVYLLVPIETAVISALAIYLVAACFPIGLFGSLIVMVVAPPITWLLLHMALHRSRAANA